VPLFQLRKVLRDQRIFSLPKLPDGVIGVLVTESLLVPVIDPQKVVAGASALEPADYLVLLESEYGTLAVPAGLTCGVVSEQKGTITPGDETANSWVTGQFHYQDSVFQILDIDFLASVLAQSGFKPEADADGARRHQ